MAARKLFVLTLLLAGCQAPPPAPPVEVATSTDGRRPGALTVTVKAGGKPVVAAAVRIFGDALAEQAPQQTGEDGTLVLTAIDGDDTLVVQAEAAGYLPVSRTTASISLADGTGNLVLDLKPASGIITGRIVGDLGPVPRACVSDGRYSTLTDASGQFQLTVGDARSTLKVAATGYATRTIDSVNVMAASGIGDVRLERLNRPVTVLVANACKPFGDEAGDQQPLSGLYRLLSTSGFVTLRQTQDALPDLSQVDVVFVPVPSASLPPDQCQILMEWVRQGGKLVVLGEWGGYGAFSAPAANELLQPCNLAIDTDALRQLGASQVAAGVLSLGPGPEPGLWDGIRRISLQQSAGVRVVEGDGVPLDGLHTRPIGRLGADGMRIASVWGQFSPIGMGLVGAGRVIAIGDATLWSSDGTAADGTMNLLSDDNRSFALNVFRW